MQSVALDRCVELIKPIKDAHFFYFGLEFPYWYSVAQAEKESACRHNVLSFDGIGSEGFSQITWRVWKKELEKWGIYEIKSIKNHAQAQAYINYKEYQQSWCRKLFEMYQRYNGGALVSKELQRANSCKWEDGFRACRRRDICVLVTKSGCRQWKNACDINYGYSLEIFKRSWKYKGLAETGKFLYW